MGVFIWVSCGKNEACEKINGSGAHSLTAWIYR